MYSTVNSLMSLWQFVIAGEIRVVEHCQEEVETFLRDLKPDDLFKPEKWKNMTGFVQVVPDGDILPARSKFSTASNDWQVGINHLYAEKEDALWFAVPDVVASVLLTGRIPKITDAFRIEASGTLPSLFPTRLRGMVEVDPKTQDFFRVIVDERLRLSLRCDLPEVERKRLEKALKILASASSYGIYAQMDREEENDKLNVTCHGIDAEPYSCRVTHPDVPGEFCFPPLASWTSLVSPVPKHSPAPARLSRWASAAVEAVAQTLPTTSHIFRRSGFHMPSCGLEETAAM